jgi:hypothetical protein
MNRPTPKPTPELTPEEMQRMKKDADEVSEKVSSSAFSLSPKERR